MSSGREILTVAQMYDADRLAIETGISSLLLMEKAGRAVADEITRRQRPCRTAVLCGPGNNGGDGYVIARHLAERGWPVKLYALAEKPTLRSDAAEMAKLWNGDVFRLETGDEWVGVELVVDALFGAGLDRPLENAAARAASRVQSSRTPCIAVDIPSGLGGDAAKPLGKDCFVATLTVTFFRKKLAHVLAPGRFYCGEVAIADIGIPIDVLSRLKATIEENALPQFLLGPRGRTDINKYDKGHTVVVSGGATATGAARLAARGALRVGSGLVTVASPTDALVVNASHLTTIMLSPFEGSRALGQMLDDKRKNAVVIGPAAGVGEVTRKNVLAVLKSGASVVLDADALTSFHDQAQDLFDAIRAHKGNVVLTPHAGEFERLFSGVMSRSKNKIEAAREAAKRAGAVVVLKGADTIIASTDGRAVVNTNAPATLATAGSGDVLAGFIAGLLAQGHNGPEAALAGVWLHGECAKRFGPGLIAEDLPEQMPAVLRDLEKGWSNSGPAT